MLRVKNIRVRSFSLDYLDLFWDIEDSAEDLVPYTMQVLRSEAPEGPYHAVSPEFKDQNHFRDTSVSLMQTNLRYYYRVRITNPSTGDTYDEPEVGGAVLKARPSLEALEMVRKLNLAFKEKAGRQLILFPRRRSGQICTNCVDPISNTRTLERCQTCYDTRYTGGFHKPVLFYGGISNTPKLSMDSAQRVMTSSESWVHLCSYPPVNPGDIIVEAENIRWRVGPEVRTTERLRYAVHQAAHVTRVQRGDIEYELPIVIEDIEDWEASPAAEFTNPRSHPALAAEIAGLR